MPRRAASAGAPACPPPQGEFTYQIASCGARPDISAVPAGTPEMAEFRALVERCWASECVRPPRWDAMPRSASAEAGNIPVMRLHVCLVCFFRFVVYVGLRCFLVCGNEGARSALRAVSASVSLDLDSCAVAMVRGPRTHRVRRASKRPPSTATVEKVLRALKARDDALVIAAAPAGHWQ